MDIEYFRQFLEMSKGGSITQAAKDLYTSQSSLSRHIQALEEDFSTRLLTRTGSTVELTPEGEVVLDLANRIVTDYDNVKQAFSQCDLHSTELMISGHIDAPEDIVCFLRAAEACNRVEPRMAVHFVPYDFTSPASCREKLASGESDVMFLFGDMGDTFADAAFASRVVVRRRWMAIMEDGHPLAGKAALTLDDLQNQTIIHLVGERFSTSWRVLRSFFDTHGIKINERLVRCQSIYDYLHTPLGDALLLFPPAKDSMLSRETDLQLHEFDTDEDFVLDLSAFYLKDAQHEKAHLIDTYLDAIVKELKPQDAGALASEVVEGPDAP